MIAENKKYQFGLSSGEVSILIIALDRLNGQFPDNSEVKMQCIQMLSRLMKQAEIDGD